MMKLYYYSNEFVTLKEAKWIVAKCFIYGIFIGVILFAISFSIDQSYGNVFGSSTNRILALENDLIHQQMNILLPQVNMAGIQTNVLRERDDVLHILLQGRRATIDSTSQMVLAANILKSQSGISAATTTNP